jgi:hypothetical protein
MVSIAAKLIEQATDVHVGLDEHDQYGVCVEHFDDGETVMILEHCCHQRAALYGVAQFVGRADDGRNPCSEVFRVEPRRALAIYQEPVAPEHDCGFHSITLSNRANEVSNTRHAHSTRESAEKLKDEVSEVKL